MIFSLLFTAFIFRKTFRQPTIFNGLSNGTSEWAKVLDTVVQLQHKAINEETAFYRVVKIRWENLIINIDDINNRSGTLDVEVNNKVNFSYSLELIFFP